MHKNIYINDQLVLISDSDILGIGNEAVVAKWNKYAVKIYKDSDHPDYQGNPHEQQAARERLAEHQTKLREFPNNLPGEVVSPQFPATDQTGRLILGFGMELVPNADILMRFADSNFRAAGISFDQVRLIIQSLHKGIAGSHDQGFVFGDLNDRNILVPASRNTVRIADADAGQFGKYVSKLFTAKFVDPLHCDPQADELMLAIPHNKESDWYAFAVILFQLLLYTDPYGGIYRPTDKRNKVSHKIRPLRRVTVFNPEVRYPKNAIHFSHLSDDLLQIFHQIFEKDERFVFPYDMLTDIRWTTCTECDSEHARHACPVCQPTAQAAVKQRSVYAGTLKAHTLHKTRGLMLNAKLHDGENLQFVFWEQGQFRREDGSVVTDGQLDPSMKFRVNGDQTLIAKGQQVLVFSPNEKPEKIGVDLFSNIPVFDTDGSHIYYTSQDQLVRRVPVAHTTGTERMGSVLSGQTLFWVNSDRGLGFYRAESLTRVFFFDPNRQNSITLIRDVPHIRGQLLNSACVFSSTHMWFLTTTQEATNTINRCYMITRKGKLVSTAEAEMGDGSWLGTINGMDASQNQLFCSTDEGIVRVDMSSGTPGVTEFRETEQYVSAGSYLFLSKNGIYSVSDKEVHLLIMG